MQLSWAGVDHWVVSLGCGLLIGLVSERRGSERESIAGTRTHAIAALLGCAAWWLGVLPFAVVLLLVGALTVAAYWHSAPNDPGLTRRCCINQPQARLPQPQAWLRHSRRLRTAQLCEPIEDGSPNVQFVDLSLERA